MYDSFTVTRISDYFVLVTVVHDKPCRSMSAAALARWIQQTHRRYVKVLHDELTLWVLQVQCYEDSHYGETIEGIHSKCADARTSAHQWEARQ